MSNLFELSAQYQQIMNEIMLHDEITNEQMQLLESVNDDFDNKILNYTSLIKSMEAKAKSIKEAMEKMDKRIESLMNGADRLKESIKSEMKNCDKKKIENEYHQVLLIQNNPKVEYSDKSLIPSQYWKHKVKETLEVDTSTISKLLKEGEIIPGAYLERDVRVSIR